MTQRWTYVEFVVKVHKVFFIWIDRHTECFLTGLDRCPALSTRSLVTPCDDDRTQEAHLISELGCLNIIGIKL